MSNIIALALLMIVGYLILNVISRKKRELALKEEQQREVFLKETQALLKTEAPAYTTHMPLQTSSTENYCLKVNEYFLSQGYTLTQTPKVEGIDLIGVEGKELILLRCESELKEVKKIDLKLFIADCSVYIDANPMMRGRNIIRTYVTNRPITDEGRLYMRENSSSLRVIESI